MRWTTTTPTEPGFYWMMEPGRSPVIAHVDRSAHRGKLDVYLPGWDDSLQIGASHDTPDISDGTLWAGPLTPPIEIDPTTDRG